LPSPRRGRMHPIAGLAVRGDFLEAFAGLGRVVVREHVVPPAVAEDVLVVEWQFHPAAVAVAVILHLIDALDPLPLGLVVLIVPALPGRELFIADPVIHFPAAADL